MHSKEHSCLQSQIALYLLDENIKSLKMVMANMWKCVQQQWNLKEEATSYTFFQNIFFSILG
jgi:hypothetical protein